ncbi:MAG: tRNA modification GTPase MnmE [Firmicutes bacterium]|nr:tRNA modification GTPase MnmE [Bacillota bacterium]
MYQEVIAAISTAPGEGGIAIVRLSGDGSIEVVKKCFRRRKGRFSPRPWRVYLGDIVDSDGRRIDECLLTFFRSPNSYTGEDVVELGIHGGAFVAVRVLERLLECGAVLAAPGEFTKRAFLQGRLDLSQAEAVIDVIRATSDVALQNANLHLRGALTAEIREAERALLRVLALIEAQIDFPDMDTPKVTLSEAGAELEAAHAVLSKLLASARRGRVVKEGYRVVIVGRPNVGKSSLFNYLAGQERAIVTDIAGTTRDILEVSLNINGLLVNLLDTAGLRGDGDFIENLGMARTEQAMLEADLLLVLLDGSTNLTTEAEALLAKTSTTRRLLVVTKVDLPLQVTLPPAENAILVSTVTGGGMVELRETLAREAGRTIGGEHNLLLTNIRHTESVRRSREATRAAVEAARAGWELELVAIDVRQALDYLGEVGGRTVSQSLTDEIFAQFCIGK